MHINYLPSTFSTTSATSLISTTIGMISKDRSVTASGRPWLIKFWEISCTFGGPYSRRKSDPDASEPARITSLRGFSEGFWNKYVFLV